MQPKKDNSVETTNDASKARVSDKLYSAILDQRNAHLAGEREAGNSYDRWLLTLSGGALALSLTLARDIASPSGAAFGVLFLGGAWILLVVAVALGLWSIYTSQKAHEEFRRALDDTLERTTSLAEKGFWNRVRDAESKSKLPSRIEWFNKGSLACFVVGTIFLCVFACVNVWSVRSTEMTDERNEQQKQQPVEKTDRPVPIRPDKVSIPPIWGQPGHNEAGLKPAPAPIDQYPAPKPTPPPEPAPPPKDD